MIEFKTISYEVVSIGEEFRSDDFTVKPEDVDTFAFAVDDHDPWYFEDENDSPYDGKITHPVLLAISRCLCGTINTSCPPACTPRYSASL